MNGFYGNLYHEKQVKELCALHALNNLFQTVAFTKTDLDGICRELSPDSWLNPHRSPLGLGNYDINVIMAALHTRDCEALWFDKRKKLASLVLSEIVGFILNVPSEYRLGFLVLPLRRRHWVAVRKAQSYYYNLDSKLDSPLLIGQEDDLLEFLQKQVECPDKELFIVVSRQTERKQSWLRDITSVAES